MKLRHISMVDFLEHDGVYTYIYAIHGTAFFSNHYIKLLFESHIPHFMWTEIQSVMSNEGIYFEDLIKGLAQEIPIGTITIYDFSDEDRRSIGTNRKEWKLLLDKAIDAQKTAGDDHIAMYGRLDLTGTGLLTPYEPHKEW